MPKHVKKSVTYLTYDETQVKKAAKFLWKKNPYAPSFAVSVEDLEIQIKQHMLRYAKEVKKALLTDNDWRYVATGGYFILITAESDDELFVNVLVEPSIGCDQAYDTIEV